MYKNIRNLQEFANIIHQIRHRTKRKWVRSVSSNTLFAKLVVKWRRYLVGKVLVEIDNWLPLGLKSDFNEYNIDAYKI